MALKDHAFLAYFAGACQRKYLVAAAVGEDGPVPAVEAVQAAGAFQHFGARTQVEMVGIAQDDLRLYIVGQLPLRYGFYAAGGAYGHENRGEDLTVVGGYPACPGFGAVVCVLELKPECWHKGVQDTGKAGSFLVALRSEIILLPYPVSY